MNQEKLAKLAASVRIGGKGTPRRKKKAVHKAGATDDKKFQATLKKLGVQPLGGIEEVNMFRKDGKIIHFKSPKVQAAVNSNTFTISGNAEEKELAELVPGILNQMGTESLNALRVLAQGFKDSAAAAGVPTGGDDDIPDLIPNFEEAAKADVPQVEEVPEATSEAAASSSSSSS